MKRDAAAPAQGASSAPTATANPATRGFADYGATMPASSPKAPFSEAMDATSAPTSTVPTATETTTMAPRRKRLTLIGAGIMLVAAATAVVIWLATKSSSTSSSVASTDKTRGGSALANASTTRICDDARQDAGYITLPNKKDGHYFYWYFESRRQPRDDPLVLWLSGGPGCSSLWTLLAENGPCSVEADGRSTKRNPNSWTNVANVIWLDQPTFTGFSYGDNVTDIDSGAANVQENLYWFLQGFLDKHPELRERGLYLAGESYAGHYIPPSAHYIWKRNTELTTANATRKINLQGVAIGNGLTAPSIQFAHYLDMANNTYNITLADPAAVATARTNAPACSKLIDACQVDPTKCLEGMLFCKTQVMSVFDDSKRNPYDIRMPCNSTELTDCYDTPTITKFLNTPEIHTYLNVSKSATTTPWTMCRNSVGDPFIQSGDIVANHQGLLAELLDGSDVRVLIFAGDADLICNWLGSEAWTLELKWKHTIDFGKAGMRPFVVGNASNAGMARSYKTQFTFVRFYNAGHFVALDQPAAALEMFTRFIANKEI